MESRPVERRLWTPRTKQDEELVRAFRMQFYRFLHRRDDTGSFDVPSEVTRPLGLTDETLPDFFIRIAGDIARAHDTPIADVRQVLHAGAQLWVIVKTSTRTVFTIVF